MNNQIPQNFLNCFLCCFPGRFPIGNCHYLTGSNIAIFSKLMCVENQLTHLTCNCNNICSNIKCALKR